MEAEQWFHMGGGLRVTTLWDHADSNGLDSLRYINYRGHIILNLVDCVNPTSAICPLPMSS